MAYFAVKTSGLISHQLLSMLAVLVSRVTGDALIPRRLGVVFDLTAALAAVTTLARIGMKPSRLYRMKRPGIDVVPSDLAIEPRSINPQQICRGPLVSAGTFQS